MGFKINRVYTRSGDEGSTSLIDGARVPKSHPRCIVFGGFDEISCHLGLAKDSLDIDSKKDLSTKCQEKLQDIITVIELLQQELFDLGAEIACPEGFSYPGMWKVDADSVQRLEKYCDYFNKDLPELDSFILPGGSLSVGHLHLARSVTRRVERDIVFYLSKKELIVSSEVLKYCNRLSDLIFVLCRYVLSILNIEAPTWTKHTQTEHTQGRTYPILK